MIQVKSDIKGKVVAAAVVALAIATGGIYTYSKGWWRAPPQPAVTASELPQITPPMVPGRSKSM